MDVVSYMDTFGAPLGEQAPLVNNLTPHLARVCPLWIHEVPVGMFSFSFCVTAGGLWSHEVPDGMFFFVVCF